MTAAHATLDDAPGPRLPKIVQAVRLGADPTGWLMQLWKTHGDAFVIRIPNDPPRLVLAHPDAIREVFAMGPADYRAAEQTLPLDIGRHSILFLDDEPHARARKLLIPPLHGARLRAYAEHMHTISTRAIDHWIPGEVISLHGTMQAITLDVILACVFGVEDEAAADEVRTVMLDWLDEALTPATFMLAIAVTPVRLRRWTQGACEDAHAGFEPAWPGARHLPWRRTGRRKAAVEQLLASHVRRSRRAGTNGRTDLVSMLIDARDERDEGLSTEEIVDQLVTMVVGGHETTANAACWAMLHILGSPGCAEKIRAETDATFGPDGAVDPSRNGELAYLDACLEESSRLSPIAPAVSRTVGREVTIAGYRVPSGAVLWPSPLLAQRHPAVWDDPEAFSPERFLGEKPPRPHEMFPFGGGRRRCIGAAFAQFEQRIILSEVFRRFELELVEPEGARPVIRAFSIVPENGVRVRVKGRR